MWLVEYSTKVEFTIVLNLGLFFIYCFEIERGKKKHCFLI